MTQFKNPTEKNYGTETNEQQKNDQDKGFDKDKSQEVDLPIPEKKNDTITTGISGEKPEENTGQTGEKTEILNDENTKSSEKEEKRKTGFDVDKSNQPERKDKRGNEPERLERDDTTEPKTQDADWQQDKMNEANNQQGSKQNVDRATRLNDTRDDSILDRPKTETYEKNEGDNVGGKIKKDNYTHTNDEKKRDDNNRKNNPKTEKQY